ncbi:MAG TPA: hypothetical protein PLX38_12085 [Gammaproteobacteria bacterium]|nr:hypothetical protein [Xanthomonadales bacterium]HPI96950.1 hypothetical protein [Gammaproteobacteria bacterium]
MKFYRLLKHFKNVEILGCWSNYTGEFTEVIGHSLLGSIFLRNPNNKEYLVLHPRMSGNNAKNYGEFDSLVEFEEKILRDVGFKEYCISPFSDEDIDWLENSIGKLNQEECYYPVPDTILGGSGELNTYSKGNVWISADISGQNRGL